MIAKVCDREKQARLLVRDPPCYAEIIKFGLILTHHCHYFWGKLRDRENILGENVPLWPPLLAESKVCNENYILILVEKFDLMAALSTQEERITQRIYFHMPSCRYHPPPIPPKRLSSGRFLLHLGLALHHQCLYFYLVLYNTR